MRNFSVRSEFLSQWGDNVTPDTVITMREVNRLAAEWGVPVEELLDQLEEIDTTTHPVRIAKKHVIINKKLYYIFCIPEVRRNGDRTFSFYIQPVSGIYPMTFMYSVPQEQQTMQEAFEIAEGAAEANLKAYTSDWD